MKASVIVPILNEEKIIEDIYKKTRLALRELNLKWDLIFVDDGSSDDSFKKILKISKKAKNISGVKLSRNFGVHAAVTAGLQKANGDIAFMVSADLQEPVDQLKLFIDKINKGYDVIWGVRSSRQDPFFTKFLSNSFYLIFSTLKILPNYPQNTGFVVFNRKVINTVLKFSERNRMLWTIIAWSGFRQAEIKCNFKAREAGKSRWTFGKKIKLAIDIFTSYSYLPIRIVSGLGIFFAFLSFIFAICVIYNSLVNGVVVQGWPTMMASILFLFGIQFIVTGIIGEYIWRALDEVRNRPLYVISEET